MQTLNMTDHKHNNTQARTGKGKPQRKNKGKNHTHQRRYQIQQVTDKQTQTHKLLNPKYLLHRPHMQQNQRNSSIWYQYRVRRKIILQRQCG